MHQTLLSMDDSRKCRLLPAVEGILSEWTQSCMWVCRYSPHRVHQGSLCVHAENLSELPKQSVHENKVAWLFEQKGGRTTELETGNSLTQLVENLLLCTRILKNANVVLKMLCDWAWLVECINFNTGPRESMNLDADVTIFYDFWSVKVMLEQWKFQHEPMPWPH